MPVIYDHGHGQSASPRSGGFSHYIISSLSSSGGLTWLCGAVLVSLAILGLVSRRRGISGSRGVSNISSPRTASQSQSETKDQMNWISESEKDSSSSSSTAAWSPPTERNWAPMSGARFTPLLSDLPTPTIAPENQEDAETLMMLGEKATGAQQAGKGTQAPPPPRRRSYTKMIDGNGDGSGNETAMGIEVAEEVIVAAEGWRRHTRVYGGGVCQACLESERKQEAMGMSGVGA